MRLINADSLFVKYCNLFENSVSDGEIDRVSYIIAKESTIDPVHAAGGCYCRECWYYQEWGECKEFGDIMKPDEFCSRGVKNNNGL